METALGELQTLVTTIAAAAVTALVVYAFKVLRAWLGIKESESNEDAIRRAALTEAGKLVVQGKLDDPKAVVDAVSKVITDLHPQVIAERYDSLDIKDMIIGAAATVFPPAGLLKLLK